MNRHTTLYATSIKPINFCGKTIMWQFDLNGSFEVPFQVVPTQGEHDFNTCKKCQKTLKFITNDLTKRYQGLGETPAFPNCCEGHSKLMKYDEFVRSKDYFACVPEMVARKVIYTNQHIKNNYEKDDWYKEITDYIDYVIDSFGKMPGDTGEPLYLSTYLSAIIDLFISDKGLSDEKKVIIEEFINSYRSKSEKSQTNLGHLITIYEKWLDVFPFQLKAYFGDLREQFERQLPIFSGTPEYNSYSKSLKIPPHNKRSLILYLNELTKFLLSKIDVKKLIDENVITDVNRHKFELETESLSVASKKLTSDLSNGEKQYLKTLTKWLDLHKSYFDRITPMLQSTPEIQNEAAKKFERRISDPI